MFGAIGDSLISCAIIDDLKRGFPEARIVGFISEANKAVVPILDGIDEYVVVPVSRPHKAVPVVRGHPVDVMIDFGQWPRINAVLSALAKARFIIGFRRAGQHRHFAYDATSEHRGDRHELENFHDLARCLAIEPVGRPRLKPGLAEAPLPVALKRPYIVFHPWASGYRHALREWPRERWIELGRSLADNGYQIVLSGGPDDRANAQALADAMDRPAVKVLAGEVSLAGLATVLAKAAAVVSVNTGIMHMAAALDCQMVALHGPTNPLRWGPLSSHAVSVGPGVSEGGAYLDLGFEYPAGAPEIMSAIAVSSVISSLEKLLPATTAQEFETA